MAAKAVNYDMPGNQHDADRDGNGNDATMGRI
jgi:hypothetical protein